MDYTVFLPSEGLVKTSQWTIQALAIIGAVAVIACAGSVALYAIAWLCSGLVVFIHAMALVCHAIYDAFGGSPATMAMTLITVAMILFIIKLGCLLFPSSFTVQGVRV